MKFHILFLSLFYLSTVAQCAQKPYSSYKEGYPAKSTLHTATAKAAAMTKKHPWHSHVLSNVYNNAVSLAKQKPWLTLGAATALFGGLWRGYTWWQKTQQTANPTDNQTSYYENNFEQLESNDLQETEKPVVYTTPPPFLTGSTKTFQFQSAQQKRNICGLYAITNALILYKYLSQYNNSSRWLDDSEDIKLEISNNNLETLKQKSLSVMKDHSIDTARLLSYLKILVGNFLKNNLLWNKSHALPTFIQDNRNSFAQGITELYNDPSLFSCINDNQEKEEQLSIHILSNQIYTALKTAAEPVQNKFKEETKFDIKSEDFTVSDLEKCLIFAQSPPSLQEMVATAYETYGTQIKDDLTDGNDLQLLIISQERQKIIVLDSPQNIQLEIGALKSWQQPRNNYCVFTVNINAHWITGALQKKLSPFEEETRVYVADSLNIPRIGSDDITAIETTLNATRKYSHIYDSFIFYKQWSPHQQNNFLVPFKR